MERGLELAALGCKAWKNGGCKSLEFWDSESSGGVRGVGFRDVKMGREVLDLGVQTLAVE